MFMFICLSRALLLSVLALAGLLSFAADKQKLQEGRYGVLGKGALIVGSEHSWTMWQLPDGAFELEDHFEQGKDAFTWNKLLLSDSKTPISPEFREKLNNDVEPNLITATFTRDRKLVSLKVSGKNVHNRDNVALRCDVFHNEVDCAGLEEKTRLKIEDPPGLLWWFNSPLLLQQWGHCSADMAASQSVPVVLLSFGVGIDDKNIKIGEKPKSGERIMWAGGGKPQLEVRQMKISNLGHDVLVLGDRIFNTNKCSLEITFEQGYPISLTEWTDTKGVILAVQKNTEPDLRIGLLQYKNYSATTAPPQQ